MKSPLALPTVYAASGAFRITIGGTAREWWAALHVERDAGRMPPALESIADGSDGEVTVSGDEWARIRMWGSALPAWVERDGIEQLVSEEIPEA